MKTKLTMIFLIAGIIQAAAQNWSWSEDQLSYPRTGISAAVLDDSIFYSGGRIDDNYNFLNLVEVFDLGNGSWATEEPGGPSRWQTCAVSANGMVFIAGGNIFPAYEMFTEVDVFNRAINGWTIEYLSDPRVMMGTVANGNKVFFAGGVGYIPGTKFFYDVVDIYDTETGQWSQEYLSVPRSLIAAATAGDKVFFAGGALESGGASDVVDIYDVSNGEWTVETLLEPRAAAAAVAYGDKVYFAGGAFADYVSSDYIDVYNVTASEWEDTLTLSGARIVNALKVHDALVFTGVCNYLDISGGGVCGPENGKVDIYYPETGEWELAVPDLNPARVSYAFASYGNKAYFAGGNAGEMVYNTINILEYDTTAVGLMQKKKQGLTLSINPNPCSCITNFQLEIRDQGIVICDLLDISGVKVMSLLDEVKAPGTYTLSIDLGCLKAGAYLCVLKTSDGVRTKKVIKL